MSNLEVKDLFSENRFPDPKLKIIYLLLYTPLGIILLLIRLVVGIFAVLLASALPDVAALRNTITKLLSFALGVFVEKKDCDNRDDASKIIVSNHISRVDHFVLHVASGSVTPTKYRMQDVLENALGLLYMNRQLTAEQISNPNQNLAIFPEEIFTNGRGLLQFKSNIFDYDIKVQPVSLKVWRPPIAELAVKSLGSQWWSDMIAYLFVPCTMYTVHYLPVQEKKSSSAVEFASRIRESIADNLHIPVTSHSARDLIDYEKRYIAEQNRIVRPAVSFSGPRAFTHDPWVEQMAGQVKEVLPHVPYNVILQDLAKTGSVDYTISNILEGHVRYIPETVPAASTSQIASNVITSAPTSSAQSSVMFNFPKSANERMMSYQERKRLLIENARKKYIDKHGLNIAMNNC